MQPGAVLNIYIYIYTPVFYKYRVLAKYLLETNLYRVLYKEICTNNMEQAKLGPNYPS